MGSVREAMQFAARFASLLALTRPPCTAQWVWLGFYLATLALVADIFSKARLCPPWALILLALSKRVHSIFVLRLFNDCVAMLFLYAAVALFLRQRVRRRVAASPRCRSLPHRLSPSFPVVLGLPPLQRRRLRQDERPPLRPRPLCSSPHGGGARRRSHQHCPLRPAPGAGLPSTLPQTALHPSAGALIIITHPRPVALSSWLAPPSWWPTPPRTSAARLS